MIVERIYRLEEKIKSTIGAIPEQYKAIFFNVLFLGLFIYALYLCFSAFTMFSPELGDDLIALINTISNM